MSWFSVQPAFPDQQKLQPLQVLNLSPPLAVGLILVSCCPGGQVSACSLSLPHTLNISGSDMPVQTYARCHMLDFKK